jgi:hypothetical protein
MPSMLTASIQYISDIASVWREVLSIVRQTKVLITIEANIVCIYEMIINQRMINISLVKRYQSMCYMSQYIQSEDVIGTCSI